MFSEKDPIIAIATASGRGGVGIVRISGQKDDIDFLVKGLFGNKTLKYRYAHLVSVRDGNGELIDQAIAIYFAQPHSYTGESVLEIQSHGGQAVQNLIMDRCMEIGREVHLRRANPGEFSQRAFLNGRIDLTQAEAVADLIDASSAASARAAARSLQGTFSKKVHALNTRIVELRAFLEATLDFPEEEIDFIQSARVQERVCEIYAELCALQKSAMRGKVLRDGLTVVLVGSPNVGKSSLMNALAGEEVAIVTDIAGTTRDRIERQVQIDGLSINLIDTAGVRKTDDKVEAIGVERTLDAVAEADIVIHMQSAAMPDGDDSAEAMRMIIPRLRDGVKFIQVFNKIDLVPDYVSPEGSYALSAVTGEGMEELVSALKETAGISGENEGEFLARSRHLDCLARAGEHLACLQHSVLDVGLDIAAEELRLAGKALGDIVGETLADDLLGMIFSRFCIGK